MGRPGEMRAARSTLLGLWVMSMMAGASPVSAQGDASVHGLSAPPVGRSSHAGATPMVRAAGGDVVIAADGVLVASPSGTTRWYYPDSEILDVAASRDGAVFGLAMFPASRPTSARVLRFAPDGALLGSSTLHRRHIDAYSYSDLTAAPDGDALLCSSVREGGTFGIVINRLTPSGSVRWSRRVAFSGQCFTAAADALGNVYWSGVDASGGTPSTTVQKLDPTGAVIWTMQYEPASAGSYPLVREMTIAADGSVLVGGVFEGTLDLLPGSGTQMATGDGFTAFVTRVQGAGIAAWTWVGGNSSGISAILPRGEEVLILEEGRLTRLDARGRALASTAFGMASRDGLVSQPFVSVAGAILDDRGHVVFAGGLPEPDMLGGADYLLFEGRPYIGPRGAIIGTLPW